MRVFPTFPLPRAGEAEAAEQAKKEKIQELMEEAGHLKLRGLSSALSGP